MAKNRDPLQVSPEFKKRLENIRKKIMMAEGIKKSYRQLTEDMISSPFFLDVEKYLINKDKKNGFKIKFDRRII